MGNLKAHLADSTSPWFYSVTDHTSEWQRQNVVRTKQGGTWRDSRVCDWCLIQHLCYHNFDADLLHVAKYDLGKVRLEPMQSAVSPFTVRDLWGGPLGDLQGCCVTLHCTRCSFLLISFMTLLDSFSLLSSFIILFPSSVLCLITFSGFFIQGSVRSLGSSWWITMSIWSRSSKYQCCVQTSFLNTTAMNDCP